MAIRKKTLLNLLLFAFILSFFLTPLGYWGKVWLNRVFSFSPEIIAETNRKPISDYDWRLKDQDWAYFNFEKSRGKVVFINFWASWKIPSAAELKSIQKLYNTYGEEIDFYIITDEQREPVEEFLEKNDFSFPVTYLIVGEKSPFSFKDRPFTYILDKDGKIAVRRQGIADWDNEKIHELLEGLLAGE